MAATAVPDRGDDPKRKRNQFSSAEYAKMRRGKISDYIHGNDSGISDEYMNQLDKNLRKKP